jgi:uncharacterized protein with HEPN domain
MYSNDDLLCFNILEATNRILEFTKDFKNVEDWKNSILHYDATMMNFIVIGEMTTKISEEYKEDNPDIEWHKMYGFRNIMAHDYFGIEERIVWDVIQIHIPELKIQIEKILN